MTAFAHLQKSDPDIFKLLGKELDRQQSTLEMIASENFTSPAVMETMGSVLTNKYAEGLPGKRYYGGCEEVDKAEEIARERAKQLFNCAHANVQPHSGAQANMAAFLAAGLKAGDTILGMNLSHGGHLTHGSPVNFSGLNYTIEAYGVDPTTGHIDMDAVAKKARESKPKLIICGASAYSRVIDFEDFRKIADDVGAVLLADVAHIAGLIVTGHHPNPFPHCHIVTTTTHKTLRGPRGGMIMANDDYAKAIDKGVFPGIQGGPLMHVIAAKAVAFKEALSPEFTTYSTNVIKNAQALATQLVADGIDIVSGGTDNHVMMLDLRSVGMTGKVAQQILEEVGITANKNTIPDDPESPFVTSGLRLGSPALTTRRLDEAAFTEIGAIIAATLKASQAIEPLKARVNAIAQQFPLYTELNANYALNNAACSV